ncbi:MAG: histidine--tRNA ligase [Bacteroidota bacterium]|nr:histidine--tRNA ligase [Bacteroidota bacterium]
MKPSLPQGTRDFNAATIHRRQYILQTIREVFELYGFEPLETPAMENLETLMGKYGEEGDKLIFKILNNGLDMPAKRPEARHNFEKVLEGKNLKEITERALRYDLTIPFARYISMNHGTLNLPFKRYQMQPVWRADRPQKGRYREFYQCDADIAGTLSLLSDSELALIYLEVFRRLKIPVAVKLNNRKVLSALASLCGSPESLTAITIAIDKLDKIGIEKVRMELAARGLSEAQVQLVDRYLHIEGSNEAMLQQARDLFGTTELANQGLDDLETLLNQVKSNLVTKGDGLLKLDFTLARGLNYYTGTIYEVKATGVEMGSIGGGGRYDDLTGLFDLPGIPGVGISFGVDRIYDVMSDLQLFPSEIQKTTEVLFFNLGEKESAVAFRLMQELRAAGVRSELFYEPAKMDKQFRYANRKQIPYVVIIGSEELATSQCMVKDLAKSEQHKIPLESLVFFLKK